MIKSFRKHQFLKQKYSEFILNDKGHHTLIKLENRLMKNFGTKEFCVIDDNRKILNQNSQFKLL